MNDAELKIYKAAKTHFYTDGYYNTTVRDIADTAGVNSGLFNYYFKNKHNIARQLYDDIFYNIKDLLMNHIGEEKNPAIFMGVLMRMHTYTLYNDAIVKFAMDALKEGIFEESIFTTATPLVTDIANYYHKEMSAEALHLLLSISLATEKTSLTQKYHGLINYDLSQLADIVLKIHLQGFGLEMEEIQIVTNNVREKFDFIQQKHPDYIHLII